MGSHWIFIPGIAIIIKVQQEDNMICESVQTGLESSAYDVGRLQ